MARRRVDPELNEFRFTGEWRFVVQEPAPRMHPLRPACLHRGVVALRIAVAKPTLEDERDRREAAMRVPADAGVTTKVRGRGMVKKDESGRNRELFRWKRLPAR